MLLVYALASWAILYLFFETARPRLNLGTLFLALDIPAFVWVIYQTGGDNSWLFFLLYIRVADQTNTTFKRALALQPCRGRQLRAAGGLPRVRRAPRRSRGRPRRSSC